MYAVRVTNNISTVHIDIKHRWLILTHQGILQPPEYLHL